MPTFTELLPATKTVTHRALTWTPAGAGRGELVVSDKRSRTAYSVVKLAAGPDFPGTAVVLAKRSGERYAVRCGRGTDVSCDCAGFTYGGGKRLCKHIDCLRALVENRWRDAGFDRGDEPEANADAGEVCDEIAATY